MLAQNFKTAADLGITEPQIDALRKTLVLLETNKLVHVPKFKWDRTHSNNFTAHFNMLAWASNWECGTVHCIGGTAEAITGNDQLFRNWSGNGPRALCDLFAPNGMDWHTITPEQAAIALRSYLTTGDARWDLAVA